MPLTLDEIDRYHRQMLLPEWGAAGQERVRAARVLLRGDGAAQEAAWRYLDGAGVGRLERAGLDEPEGGARWPTVAERDGRIEVTVGGDREAVGCACAVEALKAILGLPFLERVRLEEAGGA